MRDLLFAELLALEVALHQRLVGLDDRVEQLLPVLGDGVGHLGRNLGRLALALALGARVRLQVEDVDDPGQLVLAPDREVHGDAALGEVCPELLERAVEVGALAVEHVDEDDAWEVELVGALPDARRLDLDAHDGARDDERALDHAQCSDRVAAEARVARGVDQVDLAALPLAVAERGGQRHLPALLVLVPVGGRRPLLDGAEPIDRAGLEQHRLDERGLPRAAVADDGDVADLPWFDCGHAASSSFGTGSGGS